MPQPQPDQSLNNTVQGSNLTPHDTPLAKLTGWLHVSILELKLTIECQQASGEKVDYDKENSCSICMCELYDGLEQMSLEQVKGE